MNMKTLALAALIIVGIAAVPIASAAPADGQNNSCDISGVVDLTNPLHPTFNFTVVGTVVQCIS